MKQQNPQKQLTNLVRARYPLVAVESHEETRVMETVFAVADEIGAEVHVWTVTEGLKQVKPAPKSNPQAGQQQPAPLPIAVRKAIEFGEPTDDLPHGKAGVFVFKDAHHYMNDPRAVRALRDAAGILATRHQTIILLSPTFAVPGDLEKEVAVVSYPLPDEEELSQLLDWFIDDLPESVPVTVNGDRAVIARALRGLSRFEAQAVLAQAVVATGELGLSAVDYVLREKAQIIKKSGHLEFWPEQASYSDVGGLDLLKQWTREAIAAFAPEAAEFGIEPPRGFLAVGVPGSGKSLLAKAVAGGTMPLIRLDVGALMGSLVGQSEANTRSALKTIEAVAPCVVWLDEIEKALGGPGGELDGGTSTRVLGTLLTWMQETTAPVFIVATANDIGSLRPELIRRFDEVFFVDLPQREEREEIFAIHLRKRGRDAESFDLSKLAKATEGFTGAEIEKVVKGALRGAFLAGHDISEDDLLRVIGETVPLITTMSEQIAAMREWAERARPASSRQESGAQRSATSALML